MSTMMPPQFLELLLSLGMPPETARLQLRLVFRAGYDNMYDLRLKNGQRIHDISDMKQFYRQMVELLEPVRESRPAPGYNIDFCPDCGHVHVDDNECSFPTGGNRTCRCERKVSA